MNIVIILMSYSVEMNNSDFIVQTIALSQLLEFSLKNKNQNPEESKYQYRFPQMKWLKIITLNLFIKIISFDSLPFEILQNLTKHGQ